MDDQLLEQTFPDNIAEHIRDEVYFDKSDSHLDKPIWIPTTSGKFTVNSTWKIMRHRASDNPEFSKIWTKGLPFKISVFLWKLWKGKIPTDDQWRINRYLVVSKCWCCLPPHEESIQYLFLKSDTADKVWKHFLQAAGNIVQLVQVHQVIRAWWTETCCTKLKPLYQAAPAIIT